MLRDPEIRSALWQHLRAEYGADGETEIVDELSICRAGARADLAVINGHLAGFEIKSDVDRLDRLPSQVRFYGRVFDRMTLVAGTRHLSAAARHVPDWWELWSAGRVPGGVELRRVRPGAANPAPSRFSRAQLLWRDDMLELLAEQGGQNVTRWPRRKLIPALLEALEPDMLDAEVRSRLRRRARLRRCDPAAGARPA